MIAAMASLLERHRAIRMLALSALMLAAMGVRVYNLDAPGILPEREFRSMTIARVD